MCNTFWEILLCAKSRAFSLGKDDQLVRFSFGEPEHTFLFLYAMAPFQTLPFFFFFLHVLVNASVKYC